MLSTCNSLLDESAVEVLDANCFILSPLRNNCSPDLKFLLRPQKYFDLLTEPLPYPTNFQDPLQPSSSQDFWQLWLQYYKYFFRLTIRWTNGSTTDAEDILSGVMLKAWKEIIEKVTHVSNFKFWCSRLLYNDCMEYHRKKVSRYPSPLSTLEYNFSLVIYSESPDAQLLRLELLQQTYQAMLKLPYRLLAPLTMRCIQEMPYEEISTCLKLSVVNVRKRVQQAREMLLRYVGELLLSRKDHEHTVKRVTTIKDILIAFDVLAVAVQRKVLEEAGDPIPCSTK